MAKIPETIKTCIDNYVKYGYSPGHFGEAVLKNDLQAALHYGDLECRKALPDIVAYVNSVVPPEARGTEGIIRMWASVLRERKQDPRCA
jgi:hypothetical protein